MSLEPWGWDPSWADRLAWLGVSAPDVARITGQDRDRWSIQTRLGAGIARLRSTARLELYPVVGDWVAVDTGPMPSDPWSILAVLPRCSQFARGAAGTGTVEQVLAANVDTVWIVHGLDGPLNPRRLERYLAMAWESGAAPEIILTKSDLVPDLDLAVAEAQRIAIGVEVRLTSSSRPETVSALRETLVPGRTVALLGPSGAGKSTLINLLAETEFARTGAVRAGDAKGRHTTTRRELFQIAGGALLLDTPGLRELRVWDLGEGLEKAFPEIEQLAQQCRFRDCAHRSEPGCAVLAAMAAGQLDPGRVASFRKLLAEAAFQVRKTDPLARAAALAQSKTAMKTLKHHLKLKNQG